MLGTTIVIDEGKGTLDVEVDTTPTLTGGYAVAVSQQDGSDVCLVASAETLRRLAVEILNTIPGELFVPDPEDRDGVIEVGTGELSLGIIG